MENEHLTHENSWGVQNTRYLVRNMARGGPKERLRVQTLIYANKNAL